MAFLFLKSFTSISPGVSKPFFFQVSTGFFPTDGVDLVGLIEALVSLIISGLRNFRVGGSSGGKLVPFLPRIRSRLASDVNLWAPNLQMI